MRSQIPAAVRHTVGLVLVVVVFLSYRRSETVIDDGGLFLLLSIAVLFNAWFAGTSTALAATVLGAVLGALPARQSHVPAVETHLALFIGQGVLLTALVAELRRARRTAEIEARRAHSARLDAEAASRLKDEFLGTISHELRTPLNAVLGWLHLIRTGKLDHTTERRGFEAIERNVRLQAQLTGDLLDVSKSLTGRLHLENLPVSLTKLVAEAVSQVRTTATAKQVALAMSAPDRPLIVRGDANRLRQVVWHLLANAIKFTPRGGGIDVTVESNHSASVTVRDSGAGIDPSFLPRVFDRFTQADSSLTRTSGGLGVGLSLVRELVEQHGGDIRAMNRTDGPGAVFVVRLPIRREDQRERPVLPVAALADVSGAALNGVRVLLLDHEPDARELLEVVLTRRGASVRAAGTVDQALEMLESWRPDVLVSDTTSPDRDVYTLVGKVHSLEPDRGGRIPAIALTTLAATDEKMRRMLSDVKCDLPKPVEPAALAAEVARLAGGRRSDAGGRRSEVGGRRSGGVGSGAKETLRRVSVGAELLPDGGADVRVWAPACRRIDLVRVETRVVLGMEREADGHFHVFDPEGRAGARYWFKLDGDRLRPDPASRHQPDGPHEASAYVDPRGFRWTDADWRGVGREGHVMYEMHVGTFTREGTWRAAAEQLDVLGRLGITVIEMMPIAEFPGRFGWGYDGVGLYAPMHAYGSPDDLRAFVDRAHALGIAVILDVVYNHLGPDGNYLHEFSPGYFTDKHKNDWGRALNFDGPRPAREYFVQNGGYWIDEYHFDGLRLDATQDIHDASARHVIAEIIDTARRAAGPRSLFIVAENEPQDTRIVKPRDNGGYGADALWNDDAHHTAVVALTGKREAYYRDYLGSPQELISCARFGFLYQGQWYAWQRKPRGTPALDLAPEHFIAYLENHDQVANSAYGRRLHQLASAGRYRALTGWLLLGPATPMIFQGQEFGSSKPFLYFADHDRDLSEAVRRGRAEFLSQFPSTTDARAARELPNPGDAQTFDACKLDPVERERHRESSALHRDLIALRRRDPVLSTAGRRRPEGAVLGPGALLLRYLDGDHGDRLLVVNLGCDLDFTPAREPLIAPPCRAKWRLVWSSDSPEYGGQGTRPPRFDRSPVIPGACALLFVAEPVNGTDSQN